MDFILKGKIKLLTQTFGVIDAIDYDETHFFQMIDVSKTDRNMLKKDILVSYELKPNKRGKNEASNIKILNIKQELNKVNLSLINYSDVSSNDFFELFLENYINFEDSRDELNEIIKLIVRDNVISKIEEKFLLEKANELNLDTDLINKANEYLNSNNPFLDNILKVIFKDEIIKENELDFLFEKSNEYGFSKSFVNIRFWQHLMNFHKEYLIEHSNFSNLIKLWGFTQNFKLSFDIKDWVFMQMDIFKFKDFNKSIINSQKKLESVISNLLSEKFTYFNFEQLYKKIKIKNIDVSKIKKTSFLRKISDLKVDNIKTKKTPYWNSDFLPLKFKKEIHDMVKAAYLEPKLFTKAELLFSKYSREANGSSTKSSLEFDKIVESLND